MGILSFLRSFAGKTQEILQNFTPMQKYALTKRKQNAILYMIPTIFQPAKKQPNMKGGYIL